MTGQPDDNRNPSPKHILLVDDSRYVRAYLKAVLSAEGFQAAELAPAPPEALLEAILQVRPDLIITDYEMPECDGITLIKYLRRDPRTRDLPVLLFSAHLEADLAHRLGPLPHCGYLPKPASPEDLVAAVRAACP